MSMTLDQLKKAASDTKVECLICHKKFYALAGHLTDTHNMSVGQYKNRFQQAQVTSALVLALMKQRPRVRFMAEDVIDQIWQQMGQWSGKELEQLGAKLPHNNPELVPEKDEHFVFSKRETAVVSLAVAEGMNLYIAGPTECGKTALVSQVHAAMNRPMFRCNMTGDTTVKNFVGQMHLGPNGTYFRDGVLLMAMRAGATLLVDEIDFMPSHIGAVLHPVMEGGRSIYVPDLSETVVAKKGFTVVATANTGGKGDMNGIYTGTEVLNTAFLDRFHMRLEMTYLPAAVETGILMARFPSVDKKEITDLLRFAGEVRESFKQGNLELPLGSRKLNDFFRIKAKLGWEEAYKIVLMDWLTGEEQQLLDQIKQRCFAPTAGPRPTSPAKPVRPRP